MFLKVAECPLPGLALMVLILPLKNNMTFALLTKCGTKCERELDWSKFLYQEEGSRDPCREGNRDAEKPSTPRLRGNQEHHRVLQNRSCHTQWPSALPRPALTN